MSAPNQIGLIGAGLLGSAIARRLLKAGFQVVGYDPSPHCRDALTAAGGDAVETTDAVFQPNNIIILSLPDSNVVSAVLHDQAASIRPGSTIIDTTTGEPSEMISTGQWLLTLDVHYVEATVAGSSLQMEQGEAVVFVGGPPLRSVHVTSVLDALSTRCFELGEVGAASRFKLVHNLILGLNRAVLAEGLSLAEGLGFDLDRTLNILKQTPAASTVMSTKGSKMVSGDYAPQAKLSQHLKDVRLILSEFQRAGRKGPLSEQHEALLIKAQELGFGEQDNCAILEAFREL